MNSAASRIRRQLNSVARPWSKGVKKKEVRRNANDRGLDSDKYEPKEHRDDEARSLLDVRGCETDLLWQRIGRGRRTRSILTSYSTQMEPKRYRL
jgi:hypothetical protein